MVRADFPTPDQWIPERMGESVIVMLTTTADDDKFILSQELCLETVSRKGSTGVVRRTLDMARHAKTLTENKGILFRSFDLLNPQSKSRSVAPTDC